MQRKIDPTPVTSQAHRRPALARWVLIAGLLALGACSTAPKPGGAPAPAPGTGHAPAADGPVEQFITHQTPAVKAYRKLAAAHIYKTYPRRIYKGKIPPLVYAVVVVETEVDATGKVTRVNFSRTPGHAAEVAPKIATLIRDAAPLPSPGKLGAHTYVDTWLWDRGGNFQLDTLTKGQRSR